jgi:hypothetical protein
MWSLSCPSKTNEWTLKLYCHYHLCGTVQFTRKEYFPHWYEMTMIQVTQIHNQSVRHVLFEFIKRMLLNRDNNTLVIPPGLYIPIEVVDIILKHAHPHVGGWELKQIEN